MLGRLGRLGSAVALASVTALVLAGCTPPEPTEEEIVADVRGTVVGFLETVEEQYSSETVTPERLEQYATEELAAAWAADLQASLDAGTSSHGVPIVTDIELVDESSDSISAQICTDDRDVVTTRDDGTSPEGNGLVAWEATLVPSSADGASMLLDSFDPIVDQSICGG